MCISWLLSVCPLFFSYRKDTWIKASHHNSLPIFPGHSYWLRVDIWAKPDKPIQQYWSRASSDRGPPSGTTGLARWEVATMLRTLVSNSGERNKQRCALEVLASQSLSPWLIADVWHEPAILLLGIYTREDHNSKRCRHPKVHSSSIYDSQYMEAT